MNNDVMKKHPIDDDMRDCGQREFAEESIFVAFNAFDREAMPLCGHIRIRELFPDFCRYKENN